MKKLFLVIYLFLALFLYGFSDVSASSNEKIVISDIQVGSSVSASHEFVQIYNNSDENVDITNWCLYYASATSTQNGSKMQCFLVDNSSLHLFLPSHSGSFLISNQLSVYSPDLKSDGKFSATLSATGGHVRLIDDKGDVIDKVGWGTAVASENLKPVPAPSSGKILSRKIIDDIFQDSDDNYQDFYLTPLQETYISGNIYEVQDLCQNIDEIQSVIPDGYISDEANNCTQPKIDLCSNLDGEQEILPKYYLSNENNECDLNLPKLEISEILPNPVGIDSNNEFIEIYNPNDFSVDLANYLLYVNKNFDDSYNFPVGSIIGANSYLVVSNSEVKFHLSNTLGSVRLSSIDGKVIDETDDYNSPPSGESWAYISNVWQYTNSVTLGNDNIAGSNVSSDLIDEVSSESCPDGQYRNFETNRCRKVTSNQVTPCKDGQYRNEETGRCRNIAADVTIYAPCDEGEERNPETNRCRSIAAVLGISTSLACPEGQERNPETNRCRKIVNIIESADYRPDTSKISSDNSLFYFSIIGVLSLASVYAVWEWRVEIIKGWQKLLKFVRYSK